MESVNYEPCLELLANGCRAATFRARDGAGKIVILPYRRRSVIDRELMSWGAF